MSGLMVVRGKTTALVCFVTNEELPMGSEIANRAAQLIGNISSLPETMPMMVLEEPERLVNTPTEVVTNKRGTASALKNC